MDINRVNELLESFYKVFYKTEDMALKRGIKSLTHTELHIIEAIGNESVMMNELADRLGITMGTATVAISKLTEKGYIDRNRSDIDRRKVYVSLTKTGLAALSYHNNYHKMIMASITESIPKEDLNIFVHVFEIILKSLKNKTAYFKPMTINDFPAGTKVSIVEIKGTPIVQNYFAEHGIENFAVLRILPSKDKEMFSLEKSDGTVLNINVLDAKNLIGIETE
ncbi:MAG: MarR family winged helix-turn-helix transcriptional regulator [Fusobacteriaceae bacterium]|jgi:DNA-binding MarR family transcriptional regulator|nr:MarR family winged helix-turn-helix transcriptional regulator [Fusobacteriaceae bacterium]